MKPKMEKGILTKIWSGRITLCSPCLIFQKDKLLLRCGRSSQIYKIQNIDTGRRGKFSFLSRQRNGMGPFMDSKESS